MQNNLIPGNLICKHLLGFYFQLDSPQLTQKNSFGAQRSIVTQALCNLIGRCTAAKEYALEGISSQRIHLTSSSWVPSTVGQANC